MIEFRKDRISSQKVEIIRERADHEKHRARTETYYRELCGRQ